MMAALRRAAAAGPCSTSGAACACTGLGLGGRRAAQLRELQNQHVDGPGRARGLRWKKTSARAQARLRGSSALRELAQTAAEAQAAALEAQTPTVEKLEWASPLRIVVYPDPRLRAVNARVGCFDETLRKLAAEMFQVMYHGAEDDGVGLAAPQVGVNVRVMVFNPDGKPGSPGERVLVNPKIISTNKLSSSFEEGCLSFPHLYGEVQRPTRVKIKAQDLTGQSSTFSLNGFAARVFQHEYDHLQGTLFHDRMDSNQLARIHAGLVALEEGFNLQNPTTSSSLQRAPAM